MGSILRTRGYPGIKGMSPRQIVFWWKVEMGEDNRRVANAALAARIAQFEPKPFEEAIESLTEQV
ncbi:hypothetical protein [Microvirga yunnanensis]|uniref:hypothetical protein n=1 Tax=Microvirga yunnanensis TaxID=2953740 RepID=UPI0021C88F95|nr:hypothetical protein [Microvirga sp. HBU67655]